MEDEIKKGFNQGYLIARFKPELWGEIKKSPTQQNPDPFTQGLMEGGRQFDMEKELSKGKSASADKEKQREKAREQLREQQQKGRAKDRDKGHGR